MLRAALADSPSRRFFAAHAQSCLGSGLAHVALPLIAYEHTHSAWAVTAVLIPDLLPAILFGPLLGALVDRVGWRTCAIAADLLRMVAFTLVVFAHSLPWMVVGAALAGIGQRAVLPRRAGGRDAPRARGTPSGRARPVRGTRRSRPHRRPRDRRRPARAGRARGAARRQRGDLRDLGRAADHGRPAARAAQRRALPAQLAVDRPARSACARSAVAPRCGCCWPARPPRCCSRA